MKTLLAVVALALAACTTPAQSALTGAPGPRLETESSFDTNEEGFLAVMEMDFPTFGERHSDEDVLSMAHSACDTFDSTGDTLSDIAPKFYEDVGEEGMNFLIAAVVFFCPEHAGDDGVGA